MFWYFIPYSELGFGLGPISAFRFGYRVREGVHIAEERVLGPDLEVDEPLECLTLFEGEVEAVVVRPHWIRILLDHFGAFNLFRVRVRVKVKVRFVVGLG